MTNLYQVKIFDISLVNWWLISSPVFPHVFYIELNCNCIETYSITDSLISLHHNCQRLIWLERKPWLFSDFRCERSSLFNVWGHNVLLLFQIECSKTALCRNGDMRGLSPQVQRDTNIFMICLKLFMWFCRWALQPDGSKHPIPRASCAMNSTGTRKQQVAQVRHSVVGDK